MHYLMPPADRAPAGTLTGPIPAGGTQLARDHPGHSPALTRIPPGATVAPAPYLPAVHGPLPAWRSAAPVSAGTLTGPDPS